MDERNVRGRVLVLPGAEAVLCAARVSAFELVARHLAGDWGEVTETRKAANERSFNEGWGWFFSVFRLPDYGPLVLLISDWIEEKKRVETTVLLAPEN